VPQLEGLDGANFTAEFVTFVQLVRQKLRDRPELNRLISGQESSNAQIVGAIIEFLSDFTQSPPPLGVYTLEQLLTLGFHNLCMRGTIISLFESIGALETRNHLPYSDGGINVSVSAKTPEIMQWLTYNHQLYDPMRDKIKISLNIQQILGEYGVHSNYFIIYGVPSLA